MGEIKADVRLQQVMERTMANLRFVFEHRGVDGPFEVVQLVNSFSGAFVHPWEEKQGNELSRLGRISLDDARALRWPVLEKEFPTDCDPASYHQMLYWTRHAFAHGNIAFVNNEGQISGIKIWNHKYVNRRPGPRNWGAVATVRDMESFLKFFCDLASGSIPTPISEDLRLFANAAD